MNSTPQTLKGFRDFLPEQAKKRQWLRDQLETIFERWGYEPLETPTLEPLELFAGQIGEDEKLFYSFKDQGNRSVALRYDQTVPTVRVIGQYGRQLPLPFKRYQIQPAFRAEKPQRGRYREFLQCDADIFGVASPLADAETIALSLDIYRSLGFPQAIALVNDRTLLKGIPYTAVASIDKLTKLGPEGVVEDMSKKGIPTKKAQEYLRQVRNLSPNNTINTILTYLKHYGFPNDWYQFDPTIARSFSYSEGPIWEIIIPGFDAGSVLGGERYDGMVKRITGLEIPATGFAVGFDRTLEATIQFSLIPPLTKTAPTLIISTNSTLLPYSLEVAKTLRQANINVTLYPEVDKKLDKQLKYANRMKLPFVVIIGETEAREKTVTLKNMASGDQQTLPLDQAITHLQS